MKLPVTVNSLFTSAGSPGDTLVEPIIGTELLLVLCVPCIRAADLVNCGRDTRIGAACLVHAENRAENHNQNTMMVLWFRCFRCV